MCNTLGEDSRLSGPGFVETKRLRVSLLFDLFANIPCGGQKKCGLWSSSGYRKGHHEGQQVVSPKVPFARVI